MKFQSPSPARGRCNLAATDLGGYLASFNPHRPPRVDATPGVPVDRSEHPAVSIPIDRHRPMQLRRWGSRRPQPPTGFNTHRPARADANLK